MPGKDRVPAQLSGKCVEQDGRKYFFAFPAGSGRNRRKRLQDVLRCHTGVRVAVTRKTVRGAFIKATLERQGRVSG